MAEVIGERKGGGSGGVGRDEPLPKEAAILGDSDRGDPNEAILPGGTAGSDENRRMKGSDAAMATPNLTPDLAREAGLRLVGTTDYEETAINAVLGTDLEPGEAEDLVPGEVLAEIYDVADRCRCCDWWFEVGELDDDDLCQDCR